MPAHLPILSRYRSARIAAIVTVSLLAAMPAMAENADLGAREAGGSSAGAPSDGFAGASGDAAKLPGSTIPSLAGGAGSIRGIDVSHYQGSIDWSRVAGAGKEFAYLKSTDDTDYTDPTFAFNRAQAKANGLSVGAYHFARPDPSAGDAIREARWFVQRTNPRPGELLPVLDIETRDGLTQAQMTTWAHRWIEEVRRLTGVTAMVYTSPYGWLERFGDTRRLAREGSPLWVAHWGVSSPLVPAGNWDGNGWELWQYTSHGHVAGIQGRVDLDELSRGTLGRLTIRKLSLDVQGGAGVVTSAPSGLGCTATCEKNVDPNRTFTLTAVPDEDAYFLGWGGACSGTATTCTVTMQGNRSVTAEFVTDIIAPVASLEAPAGFTDPVTVVFDEPVRGVSASNTILRHPGSGGVAVSRTCRSGAGAPVPCANGKVRSVDMDPRRPLVPGRSYEAVVNPSGAQPVADLVGNPALKTLLSFNGQTVVDQAQVPVDHLWREVNNEAALGGSFVVERQPGAELTFDFAGGSLTWHTAIGPAYGRAEISIDGRSVRVVDLWSAQFRADATRRFDGLGGGGHTITIRPTGHARPRASDHLVAVDGFGAGHGIVRTPSTQERWRTVAAGSAFRGSYAVADLAGAAIVMRFDGVGVDLTTVTGPDRGRARVVVDGAVVTTIDLYSPTRTFGVVHHIGGLTDGVHTFRVEATGSSQAGAAGSMVAFDRLDVLLAP
jgi:GH25 family lysozyme M1 (1,4-beta-N-acetylmuramidase)